MNERIEESQSAQILVGRLGKAGDFGLPLVLERYGPVERYITSGGDRITILPTCEVPASFLLRERWAEATQMGNVRSVRAITMLDDGSTPSLVVKSPERVFTASDKQIEAGNVWWGGSRSGERSVRIDNDQVVEQQSVWEAAVLLELLSKGFKAEVPQALIERSGGQYELVVKEIESDPKTRLRGHNYSQILQDVRLKTSLIPEDSTGYNCIRDRDGFENIIDVNRWSWSPSADSYKAALLKTVRRAVRAEGGSRLVKVS